MTRRGVIRIPNNEPETWAPMTPREDEEPSVESPPTYELDAHDLRPIDVRAKAAEPSRRSR